MISTERREQIERMRLEDIARMEANAAIPEDQRVIPTADDDMNWIRGERDRRLVETDWTQGEDVPVGIRTSYKSYRQELRDIPSKYTKPLEVVWPTKPS